MPYNKYDNEAAVSYALKYAVRPNQAYPYIAFHGDGGGDCTNFISQCLHFGGAPMDFKSSRPWWYKSVGNFKKWSLSWASAHSLYWCLKIRGIHDMPGIKGIETPDINILSFGDIIQYENSKGVIYHSAMVTAFDSRGPLISQHSYDAENISYVKPAAKMHFMKIIVD